MVEKSQATGGGDVPAFEWNVIHEENDFFVEGIRISPLNGERRRPPCPFSIPRWCDGRLGYPPGRAPARNRPRQELHR